MSATSSGEGAAIVDVRTAERPTGRAMPFGRQRAGRRLSARILGTGRERGCRSKRRDEPPLSAERAAEAYVSPFVDPLSALAYVRATTSSGLREPLTGPRYWCVRAFEVVVATTVLLVASPILLAMVLAIRLDSVGPAMFRQRRIGRDLKPFTLYKARTLYVDARERFPELYAYKFSREQVNCLALADLKAPNDPRVTRIGRWLRRSSLDELPNFINVLRGDMALVGPRPEIYECLKYYERDQLLKFAVRPGLTGLAQVSGRNRNTFQQMIEWDLLYVRRRSFALDASILLRTVRAVLTRDGAW